MKYYPSHKFHQFAIAVVLLFIAADSHHWYVRYPLAAGAAYYLMSAVVMLLQETVRGIAKISSPMLTIDPNAQRKWAIARLPKEPVTA